jgi:hypothetical protein
MSKEKPVVFRHQSGEMKSVAEEARDLLLKAKDIVLRVSSKPPPNVLRKEGLEDTTYSFSSEELVPESSEKKLRLSKKT